MITLVTGTPGSGKTAWIIKELLEFKKNNPNSYLFIHGVRNLRGIPHETIYCRSQLCDICRSAIIDQHAKYVEDWVEWKEPDSLIVVDETQRIWRPRTGGSQPSVAVSTLETHRHYGVDFWLISQGPHLFDNFIRLLVGRHIHLVAKWSGRTQYEWAECKQDLQSRTDAIIRPYTLPKHVFKHYDSAEVHTKQDKRKPLSLYAVIILFFVAAFLIWTIYNRLNNRTQVDKAVVTQATPSDDKTVTTPPVSAEKEKDIAKPKYPDFKPIVEGVPESAPAYAEILKVTAVPTLMGCIYSKRKDICTCYTSQATVYPTSKPYCLANIKGHGFNPYFVKPPSSVVARSEPTEPKSDTKTKPKKHSPLSIQPTVAEDVNDPDTEFSKAHDLTTADVHMTASEDM